MTSLDTRLTRDVGIALPIIGGAMYPCSNPELVAAVSEHGGIGVIQPVSLTYVHGHQFRAGLKFMQRLTTKPLGMNVLLETSSKIYTERMTQWLEIALEEGIRFFVTSLGNPKWVVQRVEHAGGLVYHDVTERKWADKAVQGGVHGLIAVNSRAGGHAGGKSAQQLFDELVALDLPLICAGGVGTGKEFVDALRIGYDGVQLGTRLIATTECTASVDYKAAIVNAEENDIVLSERITGVPLAIIRTPYVDKVGTRASAFGRWMLRGRKTKHWMRGFYAVRSAMKLRKAALTPNATQDYWQAGKSVAGIDRVKPVAEVMQEFSAAATEGSS